jgi:hypothetical protein
MNLAKCVFNGNKFIGILANLAKSNYIHKIVRMDIKLQALLNRNKIKYNLILDAKHNK